MKNTEDHSTQAANLRCIQFGANEQEVACAITAAKTVVTLLAQRNELHALSPLEAETYDAALTLLRNRFRSCARSKTIIATSPPVTVQ